MSSFTVTESSTTAMNGATAKAFHVNANAAPWVPVSGTGAAAARPLSSPPPAFHPQALPAAFPAAGAALGSTYSGRFSLCPTFLEHGFCEGHGCGYAHTFDDLHPTAQANLLIMLNLTGTTMLRGSGAFPPGAPYADGDAAGPTGRRFPSQKPLSMNASAVSSHSQHDASSFSAGVCPPSPESASDISCVSSASSQGAPHQQFTTPPASGPASPSSLGSRQDSAAAQSFHPTGSESRSPATAPAAQYGAGMQPSPFIKSQMYYSQTVTRVSLPERCRYPHATPGTYYDYLNVKRTASKDEIVAKYQQWRDEGFRKANSIDSEKALAMDRLIVDAKNILGSDAMRAAYDALLPSSAVAQPFGAVGSSRPPQSPSKAPPQTIQPIPLPSTPESIW